MPYKKKSDYNKFMRNYMKDYRRQQAQARNQVRQLLRNPEVQRIAKTMGVPLPNVPGVGPRKRRRKKR